MNQSRCLALTAVLLASCNPFRSPIKQRPVVEVSTADANANARWNGTLASPLSLLGAVQMKGSASMTPGTNTSRTAVSTRRPARVISRPYSKVFAISGKYLYLFILTKL